MGLRSGTVKGQRNVVSVIDHALSCGWCRSSAIWVNDFGNPTVIGIVGVSHGIGNRTTVVFGDDTGQAGAALLR